MDHSPIGSRGLDAARDRNRRWSATGVVAAIVVAVAAYAFGRSQGSASDVDEGRDASTTTTVVSALTATEVYSVVAPSMVVVIADDETVGSGTIVNASGAVLTALHVVADATSIQLVFADGTRSPASVASSDAATDSTVLTPETLPEVVVPAVLGGDVEIGSTVVAVGHPFGLVNSVSEGVVSGLGRAVTADDGQELGDLVQFDAAVNPGNSGGPLLNDRGEVVGIVTALANPSDDAEFIGIGFAVPILTAVGGRGGAPPAQ
jgi:S1-C subfamily serine protease